MSNYKVLYNFIPVEEGELAVNAGDLVKKVDEDNMPQVSNGWIFVQKPDGSIGFIPETYIEVIQVNKISKAPFIPTPRLADKRIGAIYSPQKMNNAQNTSKPLTCEIKSTEQSKVHSNQIEALQAELQKVRAELAGIEARWALGT
jgi:hypothetical protein